jgi:hypothetical protein
VVDYESELIAGMGNLLYSSHPKSDIDLMVNIKFNPILILSFHQATGSSLVPVQSPVDSIQSPSVLLLVFGSACSFPKI